MRQINDVVIPTTTSTTTVLTGPAVPAQNLLYCSVQVVSGGAGPAATVVLQGSNDPAVTPANTPPTHWANIPLATVTVAGAGTVLIPKTDLCYEWVRVVLTPTATGAYTCTLKAIGA